MKFENIVNNKLHSFQEDLYLKLNNYSKSHEILGRLFSIPVSILDVTLDTAKSPLSAIELVCVAAINLVGAAFSKKYSLKDSLCCTEYALNAISVTPAKLAIAPIKILYQIFAIIIDPKTVNSILYHKPTYANLK